MCAPNTHASSHWHEGADGITLLDRDTSIRSVRRWLIFHNAGNQVRDRWQEMQAW